LTGDIFAKIKK